MKRVGKFCICLAGVLALNAGLRADGLVSPDNPYAPIVTRNVFDINPPPPVDPSTLNAEPPPKITPNGTMSVFGRVQVLFKVSIPAKPGQPAKDESYMLGEGQAQDDIEVTKIYEKAGLVTFNNHGTVQQLALVSASASGSSGTGQGGSGSSGPGSVSGYGPFGNSGGGAGNNNGIIRFGNRFGKSGGFGGQNPNNNNANNGGMNGGSPFGANFGGASAGSGFPGSQSQNPLSAEDQAAMITAQHAMAVANGDSTAPIFPPTPYDAEAGVPSTAAPPPPSPGGPAPQ